jgi:hypothetical protein
LYKKGRRKWRPFFVIITRFLFISSVVLFIRELFAHDTEIQTNASYQWHIALNVHLSELKQSFLNLILIEKHNNGGTKTKLKKDLLQIVLRRSLFIKTLTVKGEVNPQNVKQKSLNT